MTNEEKAREIAKQIVPDFLIEEDGLGEEQLGQDSCMKAAIKMAEWKDRQFKEYLEENFSDIIFECIEEYKKLKGSLNDDGTLRSDYQLSQDIAITYESKIINEFFKEN